MSSEFIYALYDKLKKYGMYLKNDRIIYEYAKGKVIIYINKNHLYINDFCVADIEDPSIDFSNNCISKLINKVSQIIIERVGKIILKPRNIIQELGILSIISRIRGVMETISSESQSSDEDEEDEDWES